MRSLTHDEARERARLIRVESYALDLDLDRGPDLFGSRTTIRFACTTPGAATHLDLAAVEVHEAFLNGRPLDLGPNVLADGRLALPPLESDNELILAATMAYSRDGQGLHRSTDPEDGRDYVYGHLFLDAARRVFACFDQPDLKAPYDVRVRAPRDWIVLGNGAATREADGEWTLATTPPLATYFVTVCAGPYASVRAEHDGIPLGLHVRASLADRLAEQAEEILTVTRQAFDAYHAIFGIRYPFGEYHQVFVPEFNAGAMENPGCVTLRDQLIPRGACTDTERLRRAIVVVHEMAHMWFGDLVTMRWWDDLWLNESFAEFMSHRVTAEATAFTDAWADFAIVRKTWGYAAERSPSTHPVAPEGAADAAAALQNFDGISYAKGAAVLTQLVAYLGPDAFDAGLRAHLAANAFGNASFADFLAAMERAGGRDLGDWARAWLQTAGLDELAVALPPPGADGPVALTRRAPADQPADRPHAVHLGAYDGAAVRGMIPVLVDAPRVEVPGLDVGHRPRLLVPDAGGAGWATIRLDADSLSHLQDDLPLLPEAVTRAVVWTALVDGLNDALIDPRYLLAVAAADWPLETFDSLLASLPALAFTPVLERYLPRAEVPAAQRVLHDAAQRLRAAHPVGSSAYLVGTRAAAAWSDDVDWLRALADGDVDAEPLASDADLRWLAVRTLARRGAIGVADLQDRTAADRSLAGHLAALAARAALPGADKAWAWAQIATGERSNYELYALAQGFWEARELGDVQPYAARFFTDVPALAGRVGEDALARLAAYAFPAVVVADETAELARAALAAGVGSPGVRREIVDGLARLEQALASRRRYGG